MCFAYNCSLVKCNLSEFITVSSNILTSESVCVCLCVCVCVHACVSASVYELGLCENQSFDSITIIFT